MEIQKLLELIEPEVKSYNMKNRRFDQRSSSADVNPHVLDDDEREKGYVGAGFYSVVKKDRDPHFVQKTSRDAKRAPTDGYWFFIKRVVDNKLWENPYFPRVYQFKKFYKGSQAHYRVKLETLTEIELLRKDELLTILNRMVGQDVEDIGMVQDRMKAYDVCELIVEVMKNVWDDSVSGRNAEKLDTNLVSAMRELKKMGGNNFSYDLHKANVMARRGPHGLHPVIIDPFGATKYKN